jgi:subtilisin family serine protease
LILTICVRVFSILTHIFFIFVPTPRFKVIKFILDKIIRMKKLIIAASLLFSTNLFAQDLKTKPNWYNLDHTEDGVRGSSTEKAYRELLKNRLSKTVLVGVIDSGIDINHEDLKDVIWVNSKEIPGNGIDDDKNGFIDDVNGWDFLGNSKGEDISGEQLESVRVYNTLKAKFGDNPSNKKIRKNKADYELMNNIKEEIEKDRSEAEMYLPQYKNMLTALESAESLLKAASGTESLTLENVKAIPADKLDRGGRTAREMWLQAQNFGGIQQIKKGVEYFEEKLNYNLNYNYYPRTIIGDNPNALEYGKYGNNEVVGPDAMHGTHVAGIIAANRMNNLGVMGVADNVKIIPVRAVPNGDELDKDVANAIRYAVDNGARVINMSFGKSYSPQKKWVDEAVSYADSKGVLLVAAAGNDSQNVDEKPQYPNRISSKGVEYKNWISVGALNFEEGADMVANFSNYGKKGVDVFAPGVAIYNTVPESKYQELDGTSMASPVVAGVAALLMSYFPELSHYQVKDIILKSSVKLPEQNVKVGEEKTVKPFSEISTTGGVVNTYEAVKMAIELTKK